MFRFVFLFLKLRDMRQYLLSSGEITTKLELYIIDLFKLNMQIYPGDIPWSAIGFDFIMTDVKKPDVPGEIEFRVNKLLDRFNSRFKGVNISLESIELLDEERARVVFNVNKERGEVEINLYEE
jgi:hypothetical protein